MYIMFLLDVTHQHHDKKWVPQSRSPKFFFAGLPPRTPPKWQLSLGHFANPPLTRAFSRSWSKKWKISCQNCVFPVFPAKTLAQFCHAVLDFREHPRASSRLSRPRPIDCDAGPKQTVKIFAVFGQFFFRTSSKKSVFKRSDI